METENSFWLRPMITCHQYSKCFVLTQYDVPQFAFLVCVKEGFPEMVGYMQNVGKSAMIKAVTFSDGFHPALASYAALSQVIVDLLHKFIVDLCRKSLNCFFYNFTGSWVYQNDWSGFNLPLRLSKRTHK